MKKFLFFTAAVIITALGITLYQKIAQNSNFTLPSLANSNNQISSENSKAISEVANNLVVPWALAFLPDGRLLITERPGRIRIVEDGKLLPQPLLTLKVAKKTQGEGGLHGITVDPNYQRNNFIYIYYTYDNQDENSLNRVTRYTLRGNTLSEDKIIIDKIPGARFHDGGRIKFGPDGYLYITTGDAQESSLAQNINSLAGKILRVDRDGRGAAGNPFAASGDKPPANLIYSYGHRNPQGITWDSEDRLWETEHGNSATDEINLIVKGRNYGWPIITGEQSGNGMESPLAQSGNETWAPGGAAFYKDSLFYAGLRGQALYELKIENGNAIISKHFLQEFGRIRDVVLGPDNFLYITTSNRDGRGIPKSGDDKILKIDPEKL